VIAPKLRDFEAFHMVIPEPEPQDDTLHSVDHVLDQGDLKTVFLKKTLGIHSLVCLDPL